MVETVQALPAQCSEVVGSTKEQGIHSRQVTMMTMNTCFSPEPGDVHKTHTSFHRHVRILIV